MEETSRWGWSILNPIFIFILTLTFSGFCVAEVQPPTESSDNCDVVGIDYQDNPDMTRAERLERMEQAFYESLHKFENCHTSPSLSSSSAASATSNSSGSDGGKTSTASEMLQGTESEPIEEPAATASSSNETTDSQTSGPTTSSSNGRIPEDIPPAENDDAIAAQIRIAAEAETDPETKKKLWNEYRKYKGMDIEQ
ncbi:hypothetical protein [Methylophaga sp.]|uniref:hypothetical protein n=1 Tax=Methylophaga sp. TaxID=2024840 RepID=UPI003F69EF1E